jgi:CMP/dCMP kinase
MKSKVPFVISLSRQLGSGAAFVGQQLADKLGLFYADRDIISKAAEQLSVLEEDLKDRDEKRSSFWDALMDTSWFVPDVYVPPRMLLPTDRELFETEAEVIRGIVKNRSAVIIGRCGFHVLGAHPNHLKVFLHGDLTFRIERIQRLYGVEQAEAEKMITRSDHQRALYCKAFTGKDWADARSFDLCIDTSKLGELDNVTGCVLHYLGLRHPGWLGWSSTEPNP